MPLRLLNKRQGEVSALSHQSLVSSSPWIIYTQMYDSEEKEGGGGVPPHLYSKF